MVVTEGEAQEKQITQVETAHYSELMRIIFNCFRRKLTKRNRSESA